MDNVPPQLNQSTDQVTAPTPEEKEAALKASEKLIPIDTLNGSLVANTPIQLANTPETDSVASTPSGPTKKDLADLFLKYGPTIIGVLIFLGNAYIHDLLQTLHISEWLVQFFTKSVQTIHEAPKQVIENTPFLEENAQGGLDSVWYK